MTKATSDNDHLALVIPSMIVFDLDDCLWTPEMHELDGEPSIPVQGYLNQFENDNDDDSDDIASDDDEDGVVGHHSRAKKLLVGTIGMRVPRRKQTVRLFDGARKVLLELATNPTYKNNKIIIAAASSSLEPSYSHLCLEGIEILPGLTMRDMFMFDQIGRTGRLSSRKTSHFRLLHEESGVPYKEMLFFDDCNWGDHCTDVSETFGVVSHPTPSGMTLKDFYIGLNKYKQQHQENKL